jgi:hypothetical protein
VAITVYEKPTSRDSILSFDGQSQITYEVFAKATAGENEAQVVAAVASLTSYFYTGFAFLECKSIHMKPQGGPYWEGEVVFGEGKPYEPGTQGNNSAAEAGDKPDPNDGQMADNSVSFEIGGGTLHITSSQRTPTQVAAPGFAVPATNNIIGINSANQRIDGVDVHAPTFQFTKEWTLQTITWGYLKTLRWLVGTVNIRKIFNFPAGELLLDGISGHWKAGQTTNQVGSWQMSARWLVEQNQVGIKVGNLPAFNKNGWDYVWFGYQPIPDPVTKMILPTPIYASVEQVYHYANHAALAIPNF